MTRRAVEKLVLEPTVWGKRLTLSHAWRLEFAGQRLLINEGQGSTRDAAPWQVHSIRCNAGWRWSEVIIGLTGNVFVRLDGAGNDEASAFVQGVEQALDAAMQSALAAWKPVLASARAAIQRAIPIDRWVTRRAAAALMPAVKKPPKAPPLGELIETPRFKSMSSALHASDLATIGWLTVGIAELTDQRNERFAASEVQRLATFFSTVESKPLTAEQQDAVVCWDERQLIVAAAGSGKTSTLIAKAGYAITCGLAAPDEILLLAFNRPAALEMQRRVEQRLGRLVPNASAISAQTTHAFALRVIGEATGRAPTVADWVGSRSSEHEVLQQLMEKCRSTNKAFARDLDLLFKIFPRDLGPINRDAEDYDPDQGRVGFRTRAGEVVKSPDEQLIADWLFFNHVDYEYERAYPVDTADEKHRQYRPDFFYPGAALWHEHVAIRADGSSQYGFEYLQSLAWKRETHERCGTRLFETTSTELRGRSPFARLEAELEGQGLKLELDATRESNVQDPLTITGLAGLFRTFMRHAKSNRLSSADLRSRIPAQSDSVATHRYALFLALYLPVAEAWEEKLRADGCVDFEDLILQAADLVAAGRWTSPYRLILADEFQDTSHSRAALFKAVADARADTTLVAVGDDWQGINRFAGADISVMTDFDRLFGSSSRRFLTETFRFTQRMADLSGKFVRANRDQIAKSVRGEDRAGPAIHALVAAEADDIESVIEQSLAQLASKVGAGAVRRPESGFVSVLLLGRYNDARPMLLDEWKERFSSALDLSFKTIHTSKGLEADYVYVLGLVGGRRGFPSLIEDDPVLRMAMPVSETFPHAEERRLFYVALTRARRLAILCSVDERYSPFLLEVLEGEEVSVQSGERIERRELKRCTSCNEGIMVTRQGKHGAFLGCSRFPACRATQKIKR